MSEPILTVQQKMFIESFEDAMEAAALACGGKKEFACAINPDLAEDPERAHRWFLDALNTNNRTVFHAAHFRRACRVARDLGCHVLKHWFDGATGYEPTPVAASKTPRQELAERMARLTSEYQRLADEDAAIQRAEVAAQIRAVR